MSGKRGRLRARQSAGRGARLLHTDRVAAEARYREAVELNPRLHAAWFDLGLIYKWNRQWEDAFDCNLAAAELVGEKRDEPAWWNLGIAATALRRWDVARRAWRAYGIAIPEGAGPIEGDFGFGPVRLDTGEEKKEVVWGHRIDPARTRLASVPFPSSGHRWADIVLHDGVPGEYRDENGTRWQVFDELERWEPSAVPTVLATVSPDTTDALDDLIAAVERAGCVAEDWTGHIRTLCAACSEGTSHGEHTEAAPASGLEGVVAIAGHSELVTEIIRSWERRTGGLCHSLDVAG